MHRHHLSRRLSRSSSSMSILSSSAVARLPPTFLAPCLSRPNYRRGFHRSSSSEENLCFRETEQSYDLDQEFDTLARAGGSGADYVKAENASSFILAPGAFKVHPSYLTSNKIQSTWPSSESSLLSPLSTTRLKSSHLVFMHPGWTSSPAYPNLTSSTASSTDNSAPWSTAALARRKCAKQGNQRLIREAPSGPPSRGTEFPVKLRHAATSQREYRTTNPTSNWTPFSVVPPSASSTSSPPPPPSGSKSLSKPSPFLSSKSTSSSSPLPKEPSGFGLMSADITNIVEAWPKELEEPTMDYRKVPLSVQRTHSPRLTPFTPVSPASSYDADSIQPFTLPTIRNKGGDSSSTFVPERVPPPHFFTSDPSALAYKTPDQVDSPSQKPKPSFVNEAEAESLGPDDLWARYLECEPAEVPPKMYSFLFKSQANHADRITRQFRLLKVFLHAAQFHPIAVNRNGQRNTQWWLSFEQVRQTFMAGIEIGETYRVDLGVLDKEERKENAGKREAAAVVLREAWRLIGELSDHSPVLLSDTNESLWRWVGLVAGYEYPDLGSSPQTLMFNRPVDEADRVEALSLFMDKVGSWSPKSLHDFAISLSVGHSGDVQNFEQEVKLAETSVLETRQTQDELLVQQDSFYSRNIRRRLWKFIVGAYKGLNGDGEKLANGWVEDLMVHEKKQSSPSDHILESMTREEDEEKEWMSDQQAASLLSRTTSAIILTRDILNGSGDISSEGVSVIIDSVLRLQKSAPPEFHLPIENLRMLLVPLLSVYPQLETISPLHHHELLLLFLRHQDLPFTRRLYEMFRLRERAFVFEEEILVDILKLALGIRHTDVPATTEDTSNNSNRHHPMARFAANIYDDHIAWGGTPLQGHILSIFLEIVGREPRLAGMATRALADSSQKWADAIVTDDIVMAIAKSSRGRVIRSIQRIVQPEDITVVKRGHVSAADAFNILPLIRGFYPSGQLPPVQVYNLLLAFIAQHPTKENVARAVAEFTVMMNHGPKPDTETFNILLRMHLGVRQGPSWLIGLFDTFESVEPEIAMVRATTLFHTMIIRESLQPDESTFTYFMEALCQLGKPMAALESFQHALKLNLIPNRSSTLKLSDSLTRAGEVDQARIVLDRWHSLVQDDEDVMLARIEGVDERMMTSTATELSKTMLSTMLNTQAVDKKQEELKKEKERARLRDSSEENWKKALGFGLGAE